MMRWAGCAHDRRGRRPTAAGAGTKQIDHACRFCGMVVSDMGYAGKGDVALFHGTPIVFRSSNRYTNVAEGPAGRTYWKQWS